MNLLAKLDFSFNRISFFPSCIGELKNLEELYLQHNLIEDLSKIDWPNLNYLSLISLSVNPLNIFPAKLFYLPINHLNLSYTFIQQFPQEYYPKSTVVSLFLNNNFIASFNSSVCNLPLLSHINLDNNFIQEIDDNIDVNCKNLRVFSLNSNFFFKFFNFLIF